MSGTKDHVMQWLRFKDLRISCFLKITDQMFKGERIFAEMLSIFNLYRKLSAEVWRGTFYVESQSQAVNHPPTRRGIGSILED